MRVLTPPRRPLLGGPHGGAQHTSPFAGRGAGREAGASPPRGLREVTSGKGGKGRDMTQRLPRNRPPASPRGEAVKAPRGLGQARPGPARRGGDGKRAPSSQARSGALPAGRPQPPGRAALPRQPARAEPRAAGGRQGSGGGPGTAAPLGGPRPPAAAAPAAPPDRARPGQRGRGSHSSWGSVPEAPPGEPPCPICPGQTPPLRCPHRGPARPARPPAAAAGSAAQPGGLPPPSRAAIFSKSPRVATGCDRSAQPLASCRRPAPPAAHGTGSPRRRRYGHLIPAAVAAATFSRRSAPSPAAPVEDGSWGKDWKLQPASEEIRRRRGKIHLTSGRTSKPEQLLLQFGFTPSRSYHSFKSNELHNTSDMEPQANTGGS
ncbi:translation initiation factor IF-2-like isoform X2 [Aquila chrysaetos chrysaetos]|uniref:translation initiation factor IF-2-like isoform X2 n=1 Tax=Aquila chrysaetos chrysaetos TaxID=223781 RepID=UPI001176F3D2|nr:translation initiation factor IF-2-like isoform X2 [Aquila chrysaetos chrysaetos]